MEGQKLPTKWIYYILSSRDDTTIYTCMSSHLELENATNEHRLKIRMHLWDKDNFFN